MRADRILREKLTKALSFMHSKQEGALWRMVEGLLSGQQLWLTELGRNLSGSALIKHRIKAVDRFLGSVKVQLQIQRIYAALAGLLLRSTERPIILIDWTGAEHGLYVLSATLAFEGRGLTILSRTHPEKRKATPAAEREFLDELKEIIPKHCRPVLVTDAGFLFKWIDAVRACGWDYVGRARFKTMIVCIKDQCMYLREAYALAKRKPRDLGMVWLGMNNPRIHRAILSARPKRKGRKSLTLKGESRANAVSKTAEATAREPLFLITSLSEPAAIIAKIYGLRMQIEQTFRDVKSHRYGWSARLIRSKQTRRVDVLLLIAAMASIVMHVLGLAVRGSPFERGLQSNTERQRRVFSSFFLGKLALSEGLERKLKTSMGSVLRKLASMLPSVERLSA